MAEKQGFHVLLSPTHDESAIVAAPVRRGKGLGRDGVLGDRLHDLRGDGTINPNAPNTDA